MEWSLGTVLPPHVHEGEQNSRADASPMQTVSAAADTVNRVTNQSSKVASSFTCMACNQQLLSFICPTLSTLSQACADLF
eukprot:1939552-Amphidinium_carterae.1